MIQTYTKGSNPYFEYAMLKYSQVAVIERMQKDDVLEHIKTLDFQSVVNVWELIHTHLENVNLSLNAYNYPNYTLPTTEKPIDKFDFITKNSKAIGAYQSGVLVNDFSYFVDSNTIAKSKANEFSQRKYELLHKVSAFTHLENKAELASVEARKAFFEAFLTILHKLHNADFEAKLNQINAELAPHLFVPEKYIRLENRQKVVAVQVVTETADWRYDSDKVTYNQFGFENRGVLLRKEILPYEDYYIMFRHTFESRQDMFKKYNDLELFLSGGDKNAYLTGKPTGGSEIVGTKYQEFWKNKDTIIYCHTYQDKYLNTGQVDACAIHDTATITQNVSTTNKTFNYMIEVEYQTQYGKDKLPNETPPAEPYKIKKLNGSWVTHDNKPLDTAGKSEDEILQM